MRGRRDLPGPPPDRWHAIDAPRLGTRPVYDAGTPDAIDATPPAAVAKEQN